MSHPSKRKGYALEVAALLMLQRVFPRLRRTGSVAYLKDAPDLVQDGPSGAPAEPIRLVVTQDKRRPILVSLSLSDFVKITSPMYHEEAVVVQCKKRERTWIGTVYDGLRRAT